MKKLNLNNNIAVTFYASPKELPICRFQQLQLMGMQESGIGSTMEDVVQHFSRLDALLHEGKIEEAITERQNLHMGMFSMINKIDHRSQSLMFLVHSIEKNGKAAHIDYNSDDGLKAAIQMLSYAGMTREMVEDLLDELKKNFTGN